MDKMAGSKKVIILAWSWRWRRFLAWINLKKPKVVLLVLIGLGLRFLSLAPYFNLVLDNSFVAATVIFLSIFILDLKLSGVILFALFWFVPLLFLMLLGRFEAAEFLGNLVYVILLAAVFKGVSELGREPGRSLQNRK